MMWADRQAGVVISAVEMCFEYFLIDQIFSAVSSVTRLHQECADIPLVTVQSDRDQDIKISTDRHSGLGVAAGCTTSTTSPNLHSFALSRHS